MPCMLCAAVLTLAPLGRRVAAAGALCALRRGCGLGAPRLHSPHHRRHGLSLLCLPFPSSLLSRSLLTPRSRFLTAACGNIRSLLAGTAKTVFATCAADACGQPCHPVWTLLPNAHFGPRYLYFSLFAPTCCRSCVAGGNRPATLASTRPMPTPASGASLARAIQTASPSLSPPPSTRSAIWPRWAVPDLVAPSSCLLFHLADALFSILGFSLFAVRYSALFL